MDGAPGANIATRNDAPRTVSVLAIALELAASGLPVFPCGPDKRPVTEHGFLDATTKPDIVREMFSRPGAVMIGVPTGEASGMDILDLDPRHGSTAWLEANQHRLPKTRTHETMNAGWHMVFLFDPRVRNSAGRIAPGVDVRASGGYVIWPGSPGYSVISGAEAAEWPDWLLQPGLALSASPPARPISSGGYVPTNNKRLEGYRDKQLANVTAAPEGGKHTALRNAGLALGGIAVEAGFGDAEAIEWLLAALPATVKDWNGARQTASWALAAGRDTPIVLEDRPHARAPAGNGQNPPVEHGNGQASGSRRSPDDPGFVWPEPLDFLADPNSDAPELRHNHIPPAINDFVFDTAARMGVDPASVALCAIVACCGVISDEWRVQPKALDDEWTENARLWGLIVGEPSVLKSPVIAACTRPIDKLDEAARKRHAEEMQAHKRDLKAANADKTGQTPDPPWPKLDRYLVEGATMEALTEVLRDDEDAHQRAPAGKVLSRQDEMSEFVASFDRYRSNGNGGADRGAYLRAYNGGRHVLDRIGRGSFAIPNWSIVLLGGIQPGPIQKIAKGAVEDGLLQRPFYAVPGPQDPGIDRKPSAEARQRYQNLFPALAAMKPRRTHDGEHAQAVVFHADAHQHRETVDRWGRAMSAMADATPQLLAAYGKWPGQFARLALTFHLIEMADANAEQRDTPYAMVITEETARRAADYMIQIALPHLLRAFRLMFSTVQTAHTAWIAGYILAERCDRITSRDVVRAYRALKAPEDHDELVTVMAQLTVMGWLEPEAPRNVARPVHVWAVNPAVHVWFAKQAEREQERRRKAREALEFIFPAR